MASYYWWSLLGALPPIYLFYDSFLPQFSFASRCRLAGRGKLGISVLQILGGQASQIGGRALGRPWAFLQLAWGSERKIMSATDNCSVQLLLGTRSKKRPEVKILSKSLLSSGWLDTVPYVDKPMNIFPTAERAVDGVNLLFYLCLNLNVFFSFYFVF